MTELDTGEKTSRRLWLCAGVIAVALHVGGAALALSHLKSDDSEEDLGATAIEIGLEMSSPRNEETDLPPGPDSSWVRLPRRSSTGASACS